MAQANQKRATEQKAVENFRAIFKAAKENLGESKPTAEDLSREDAIIKISEISSLSKEDIDGFLKCNDEERKLLIKTYKDSGQIASVDIWSKIIQILLRTCRNGHYLPASVREVSGTEV